MRAHAKILAAAALLAGLASAAAAQAEPPLEVAPQAEGTRSQTWAAVAWAAEAKCWLVAWREGDLNEQVSDIWCARVSADGKALDPAGIRITKGKGLKDRPKVASDGKGFLVVWEDLRNGKDWDVYGARLSGEGKVQDENGFVVAGGEHNQCRPDAAFGDGSYHVTWMAFTGKDDPAAPVAGYSVFRCAVPGAGAAAEPKSSTVATGDDATLMCHPVAATGGGKVWVACIAMSRGWHGTWGLVVQSAGQTATISAKSLGEGLPNADSRGPALASDGSAALVVLCRNTSAGEYLQLCRLPAPAGPLAIGGSLSRGHFATSYALAFDGGSYLLVADHLDKEKRGGHVTVQGWYFAPDGKAEGDGNGFAVAADPAKDQMLPAVAAGPAGVCLVAYTEVRGADNLKVLAKVVKNQ